MVAKENPFLFHSSYVESAWQEWWEQSGYYGCDESTVTDDEDPFVMVIPPPNVTGFSLKFIFCSLISILL